MSLPLIIEPEAEAEIVEIADWYNQRNTAARIAFLRAVNRALEFIREHPKQYQIVYREVRRTLLDGFPYNLFYKASDDQILIVACFHSSRDPNAWRDRVR